MAGDADVVPAPNRSLRVFPFRYKLTLLITAIVVLVLAAIFLVAEGYIEDEFRTLVIRQLEQTDRYVHETMNSRYEQLFSSAVYLSEDKLILDILTDKGLSLITRNDIVTEEILPGLLNVDLLVVLDDEGRLVGHSLGWSESVGGIIEALRAADWFSDLLLGRDAVGYLTTDDAYHQAVGMPVFIGEELLGIVIPCREFGAEELAQIKEVTEANIAVLRDGAVFFSTLASGFDLEESHAELDAWLSGRATPADIAVSADAATSGSAASEVDLGGERFLVRPVFEPNGFVPPYIVIQSLDERLAFLEDLRFSTMVIGSIGIAVGIALGFLMAMAVSRPIQVLRVATREVKRENLDHRVSIRTHDEFAELGASFNEMIAGLAEKKRIRSALDKSVSRDVADHILSSDAQLGGERRRATILFSDIRDFTTLAERMDPRSLITLVNAYFSRINHCIDSHHGITDKFIGDAVMALFGIPIARETHALDAIRAAQDMLGSLRAFNREVASAYDCQLDIGVGINTGDVVAGLVGSEDRLAYTAVGDEVNLASRLEGLAKLYGAKIVLGEATVAELERTSPEAFAELALRELDRVRVKGRSSAVAVYEVLMRTESPSELAPQLELFQKAHRCMLVADFEGARIHLESVLNAWPHDLVARVLRERCGVYIEDPGLFEREYEAGVRILTAK